MTGDPGAVSRRDRRRRPLSVLVRRRRRAGLEPDVGAHRELRPVRRRRRLHRACGPRSSPRSATPRHDVVLIDAHEVGSAASGRNGGLHGVEPHARRGQRPRPLPRRDRAARTARAREPRRRSKPRSARYAIDCDYERTGVIDVATNAHPPSYFAELSDDYEQLRRLGQAVELLDAEQMRAQVDSPTYTGGLWRKDRAALVDPARLAWGLKAAAESLGVRIYEDSKATSLERDGVGVLVKTPLGAVRAGKVALATNAAKPLIRRVRHYIAPVYDYCMVTEPLTAAQLDVDRLAEPAGAVGHPQPVPLLPPDVGQPDPVGWLRRRLLLARQGVGGTREPAGVVGDAQPALLRDVPPARRRQVHPRVGRRDRHLQPLLRVLGPGAERSRRVRARLHRARRRVVEVRRGGDARPAARSAVGGGRRPSSCARSHSRSRPNRSASSASRPPAGRSTARTAPASATPGSASSTASASGSTPDPTNHTDLSASDWARRLHLEQTVPGGGRVSSPG